jgi:hypothetical protein
MAIACLRIYRITGETRYREKALKMFNFMKSRMSLFQDHYVWNYWEPFGPWDIEDAESNKLRHWVNVHPYRNYQAKEIQYIAEAYHSGITFTAQDIQRLINTNLKAMWNGNKENPKWNNSNYAVIKDALGREPERKPNPRFKGFAGTLWTGLKDFSSTIRELAEDKDSATTHSSPPSLKRKYSQFPVTECHRPFPSNSAFVTFAMIPSVVRPGQTPYLICETRISGPVTIDLFSRDGNQKLDTLQTLQNKRNRERDKLFVIPWNDMNSNPGEYRIRWTWNDEIREYPIWIQY